eukprot:scaffold321746_cov32-Tisochrysis_lutea.AAC.3
MESPSYTANGARAAWRSFVRETVNTLWTEMRAASIATSATHPSSSAPSSMALIGGSSGKRAIRLPVGSESCPSEVRAPRANSISRARARASGGGGERKSKRRTLSMPRAFSCRTTAAKLQRCISGGVCSTKPWYEGSGMST